MSDASDPPPPEQSPPPPPLPVKIEGDGYRLCKKPKPWRPRMFAEPTESARALGEAIRRTALALEELRYGEG